MFRWQHCDAPFSSDTVPIGQCTAFPDMQFIPTGHGMQGIDTDDTDVIGFHSPGLHMLSASSTAIPQ